MVQFVTGWEYRLKGDREKGERGWEKGEKGWEKGDQRKK